VDQTRPYDARDGRRMWLVGSWRERPGPLSGPADPVDRPVPGRRPRRHRRASGGPGSARTVQAIRRGREPGRRRRQHRHGRRGQGAEGRLHPARRNREHPRHQPVPVQEHRPRHREGFSAGQPDRPAAEPARGGAQDPGQDRRRTRGAPEAESRQAQLRLLGRRHLDAPRVRAVPDDDRDEDEPHALPQLGRRHERAR
ncbi:MAG: BUG/TctC family periplasmic protein, partial [uncultured Microvirga sp.]